MNWKEFSKIFKVEYSCYQESDKIIVYVLEIGKFKMKGYTRYNTQLNEAYLDDPTKVEKVVLITMLRDCRIETYLGSKIDIKDYELIKK